jgi:hypothetical protein
VKRKKDSDATVDISESKNGEPASLFIIQVAAPSWAATQVPEITLASQSCLKTGFLRAVQVEHLVIIVIAQAQPYRVRKRGESVSLPAECFTLKVTDSVEVHSAAELQPQPTQCRRIGVSGCRVSGWERTGERECC